MLLSTLLPQLIACLLRTDWFWGALLTLSWILGVSMAGLGWAIQHQLFFFFFGLQGRGPLYAS